jgi:hypothetical protein
MHCSQEPEKEKERSQCNNKQRKASAASNGEKNNYKSEEKDNHCRHDGLLEFWLVRVASNSLE